MTDPQEMNHPGAGGGETVREQKKALRKQYLQIRSQLTKEQQSHLSEEICTGLENWLLSETEQRQPIRSVALYAAMGDEVNLEPLAKQLRQKGIVTAYPKCYPQRTMRFYEVDSLTQLTPSSFGVPEPSGDKDRLISEDDIDVMLIPGLAFTIHGLRLGYGGGFYDKFLSSPALMSNLIGVAYNIQVGTKLPAEPFDRRVVYLATERGVRKCTSKDSF